MSANNRKAGVLNALEWAACYAFALLATIFAFAYPIWVCVHGSGR